MSSLEAQKVLFCASAHVKSFSLEACVWPPSQAKPKNLCNTVGVVLGFWSPQMSLPLQGFL